MDYLIRCACGHAIDLHDVDGCSGERLRRCACRHDRAAAINSAISAVRSQPIDRGVPSAGADAGRSA